MYVLYLCIILHVDVAPWSLFNHFVILIELIIIDHLIVFSGTYLYIIICNIIFIHEFIAIYGMLSAIKNE